MKITVNGTAYTCTGRPSLRDPVRFNLPDGQPDMSALGNTISLQKDDGFELTTVAVADYVRAYIDGTSLVLTNAEEATEPEETTETTEPPSMADVAETLLDHETRMSLLEMGVK